MVAGDAAGSYSLRVLLRNGLRGDPSTGTSKRAKSVASEVNAIVRPIVVILTLPFTLVTLGLFLLVAAFMVMHSQTGSLDFQGFASFLRTPSSLRDVTFILLVTAFGFKSAFFPFHTWLPRAHSAAPAHVSALLSGVVSTAAGLYGILRFTLLMGPPEEWMGWYLVSFSAMSIISSQVVGGSGTRSLRYHRS